MAASPLTPLVSDLHASVSIAGQVIFIPSLFAVNPSLYIVYFAARCDRRNVRIGLTAVMLLSLVLMVARAMPGVVIGSFW